MEEVKITYKNFRRTICVWDDDSNMNLKETDEGVPITVASPVRTL
jgi:hypothetical protein